MSNIDDVLPLPDKVDVHLLCPDILVMRKIIPDWRNELIQVAERTQRWRQSGQVLPNGAAPYKSANRTSRSLMISVQDPLYGPCFRRFEEALIKAFHSAAMAYKSYNSFLDITDDSGYEMLRYQEGERFGLHTDAILGGEEGFRQLSALIYLNDDYTGGETAFPRQGVKFKGGAGDLLVFPSNFCYPHEAMPVTKGTKFAVVTWFVAYPKKHDSAQENHHGEAEGYGAARAGSDDRVLLESAGGGSSQGGAEAPDREHPACVGGCTQPGAEA
jgi:hypothetical protein